MHVNEPKAKSKKAVERPASTGKAYQELVEGLFMGSTSAEEEEEAEEEETNDRE